MQLTPGTNRLKVGQTTALNDLWVDVDTDESESTNKAFAGSNTILCDNDADFVNVNYLRVLKRMIMPLDGVYTFLTATSGGGSGTRGFFEVFKNDTLVFTSPDLEENDSESADISFDAGDEVVFRWDAANAGSVAVARISCNVAPTTEAILI